jgi:S1-C subfamily serine protease
MRAMRPLLAGLALLAVPRLVSAQPMLSTQEALLRAKPAVALVVAEIGGDVTVRCTPTTTPTTVTPPAARETGSGWFIGSSGWLITSAHVVSIAHRPSNRALRERQAAAIRSTCGDDAARAVATSAPIPLISVMLPNGLTLPATVVKYSAPAPGAEVSAEGLALLRIQTADLPTLRVSSAALQIGDRIHVVGFPGVVLGHELLNASSNLEASVSSGTVSGFKMDRANRPVIQTDAPVSWGSGGGPAVNDAGDVVGVLAFVSRGDDALPSVQGFNFVISAEAIRHFVEGTPALQDDGGRFDAVWRAGLAHYFRGEYRRARPYFAEADRLVPGLPDVRRVVADNDLQRARAPWLPWRRIAVGMLGLGAAGYAALGIRGWRRNRFRIPPSAVARLIESPDPPVILDVRDAAVYAKSPVKIPRSLHAPLEDLAPDRLPADASRTVVAYCT